MEATETYCAAATQLPGNVSEPIGHRIVGSIDVTVKHRDRETTTELGDLAHKYKQ